MGKRDEAVQRFMDELHAWGEKQEVVGDLSAASAEEAVLDAMRGNLRSIMANLGYGEAETEEVCATVRRAPTTNPTAINVLFDVPPRVVAYLDAVREQDYERAGLLLHAREG